MDLNTMEFLDLVWGERESYVDLPSKAGGHWMPWYCKWPADRPLVRRRIASCGADREDLYFSVAQFRSRGRRIADVLPSFWLWADLDRVDPVFLDEEKVLPTIAWESSPGRYQCLWRLTRELVPEKQTKLNRRLTNAIGADKGGYDLTQVLRPVETWNFKYHPAADVELMWYHKETVYSPAEVVHAIKEMEAVDGKPARRVVDTHTSTTLAQLPARARRLIRTPPEMVVVGERSHRLWELEKLLAKAGLDEVQIFDLVWPTAWNKHREVRTGEDQLRREIAKAIAEMSKTKKPRSTRKRTVQGADDNRQDVSAGDDIRDQSDGIEESPGRRTGGSPFVDYASFLSTNIESPRWLIENVWSAGSHGIVGGEPKVSKSTLTTAMALSVATGRPFLGNEEFQVPNPGPVLMIQEENAPWVVQDRLRKLAHLYGLLRKKDVEISEAPKGSMIEHIVRLDFPDEAPLRLLNNYGFSLGDVEDLQLLEDEVRREGVALVIIDPLYLVMGDTNLNNSHEIGPVLQWLTALHYNHNCAVILVHHWSKATENTRSRRSGQRLMGSAMFHGWVDSALYMEKLDSESPGLLRTRVEREFRNVAPQTDLEIIWQPGEPGELDLKVSSMRWNQEGMVNSAMERLLANVDERGLNLKHLAVELGLASSPRDVGPDTKREAALAARAAGYKVRKKKYPRGMAYIVLPQDARRNGGADE